jgi:hypothetical protein
MVMENESRKNGKEKTVFYVKIIHHLLGGTWEITIRVANCNQN